MATNRTGARREHRCTSDGVKRVFVRRQLVRRPSLDTFHRSGALQCHWIDQSLIIYSGHGAQGFDNTRFYD